VRRWYLASEPSGRPSRIPHQSSGKPERGSGSSAARKCCKAVPFKKHGFKDETEAGITMKLKRGTFSATFFLACLAAMELEEI
jgi:hypothetical protein